MNEESPCPNEPVHLLLGRYEFGAVSEDERAAVEQHGLECDVCFAELERGAPIAALLRQRAAELVTSLRQPTSSSAPARRPGSWWRARIAVPALAALALGAIGVWLSLRPDPARLARFPREPVASSPVRGPGTQDAVQELMQTGAAYFDMGRYAEAEQRFQAALDRAPELAEAAYLAGVARCLAGDPAGALPVLERAVALADAGSRPRVQWVLANAQLASRRTAEARRTLEALREDPSDFGARARDLLARLPR